MEDHYHCDQCGHVKLSGLGAYCGPSIGQRMRAERCREALNNMWGLHHGLEHKGHLNRETCPATSCRDARAAIAPEDER